MGRKKHLEKWKETKKSEHPAGTKELQGYSSGIEDIARGSVCWGMATLGCSVCGFVHGSPSPCFSVSTVSSLLINWMKLCKAHFLFCRVLFKERFIHSVSTVSDHGWKLNNLCLILGLNSVSCP